MTVLYFNVNGFSPTPSFTPSTRGTWDNETGVQNYGLDLGTSGTMVNLTDTSTTAQTYLKVRAVSPPMATSITFDNTITCIFNIRCQEGAATNNCFQQWLFGCISNDGSTLNFISSGMKDNTEMTTTLVSRSNGSGYTVSPASYVSVPGDRIFVECGWDRDGTSAGTITMRFGYTSGGVQLTGDGDTGDDNPYCDFSNRTISFDAEGTTYGGGGGATNSNQLMMTGCGT